MSEKGRSFLLKKAPSWWPCHTTHEGRRTDIRKGGSDLMGGKAARYIQVWLVLQNSTIVETVDKKHGRDSIFSFNNCLN